MVAEVAKMSSAVVFKTVAVVAVADVAKTVHMSVGTVPAVIPAG